MQFVASNRDYPGRSASKLRDPAVQPAWAAQLAQRRRELGLTQRQLADLAGVAERTVIAAEAGRGGLGIGYLERILDVLGLRMEVARKRLEA